MIGLNSDKIYCTLPPNFIRTQYEGYYWNLDDERLYSLKIGGILRKMKPSIACSWNDYKSGYKICNNGQRRTVRVSLFKSYIENKLKKMQSMETEHVRIK